MRPMLERALSSATLLLRTFSRAEARLRTFSPASPQLDDYSPRWQFILRSGVAAENVLSSGSALENVLPHITPVGRQPLRRSVILSRTKAAHINLRRIDMAPHQAVPVPAAGRS